MEENRFLFNFTEWPDDLYELELSVTDWANNTGSHYASILIDRTAPMINIQSPLSNQTLFDHHLEIQWNVSETSFQWVELNGIVIWSGGQYGENNSNWLNGSQHFQFDLNRTGNHTVCVHARDLAGSWPTGASGPNSNQSCIEVHLPEETYLSLIHI